MNIEDLLVCTSCEVSPHYDNCPECFGFGLTVSTRNGKLRPVLACEAYDFQKLYFNIDYKACPFCKSTPMGLKNV